MYASKMKVKGRANSGRRRGPGGDAGEASWGPRGVVQVCTHEYAASGARANMKMYTSEERDGGETIQMRSEETVRWPQSECASVRRAD